MSWVGITVDFFDLNFSKHTVGVKMDILDMIKRWRMNWFGHIARRDPNINYLHKAYKPDLKQKRPRGRPLKDGAI